MDIKFGPSGNSDSFYEEGYRASSEMPKWLARRGLNAYEYSMTKGVRLKEDTARTIGEQARINGIYLSIHAPYYINLGNPDPEKRERSKKYILDILMAADWMGAHRIVIHPGSVGKLPREKAFEIALNTFEETLDLIYKKQLDHAILCPETLGKKNQLGTLEEIIQLSKLDQRVIPTIDFGHIHARNGGNLNSKEDFLNIIQRLEEGIGIERTKKLHIHFSRIEYTNAGEKKHWTYADEEYGPNFDPLAEVLIEKEMTPIIICESRGTMAEDALILKKIYHRIKSTKEF